MRSEFPSTTVGSAEDVNLETDHEFTLLCEKAQLKIYAEMFISYDDALMTKDLHLKKKGRRAWTIRRWVCF